MVIKKWIKNKWFRRIFFVLIGALGGFAYYYFIGCTGNADGTANPLGGHIVSRFVCVGTGLAEA